MKKLIYILMSLKLNRVYFSRREQMVKKTICFFLFYRKFLLLCKKTVTNTCTLYYNIEISSVQKYITHSITSYNKKKKNL